MDKKSIEYLVSIAREKLIESIEEGDIRSIKFVLENLDEDFNIDMKKIMNQIFIGITTKINDSDFLTNEQKLKVITIIKTEIDDAT